MFRRIILFTIFITSAITAQGFLRAEGAEIVNDDGPVLLRGIGLGGWLVPEGYMLNSTAVANSPTEIKNAIIDLIGETETDAFFERYRSNFITERDIDSIAAWGFNSIRLPLHYELLIPRDNPRQYLESGFAIIDSLLKWCERKQIYLILDLHAAPGGQNDEAISDYDSNYPSLWESEENKQRTIALWGEIAKRYFNKQWIGGYDLLNEPKWDLGADNAPLRELFIRITDTIRTVDTNHIIFIEGNWFATSFTGLTPPWDNNLVYSFHKYWNENNVSSINYILSIRSQYDVPIWLGESGENSNSWFTDLIKLTEENNIGWSLWTIKKFSGINSLMNVKISPQYQAILNYWNGIAPKPSQLFSIVALQTMTDALKIENCKINYDVLDAVFRQPYDDTPRKFIVNIIPGFIFAPDYDLGRRGITYQDNDYQNIGGSSWNNGWQYRNDGVDIELCSDMFSNSYNVGWIDNGEWMKYTFTAEETGEYNIILRFASLGGGGKLLIWIDGTQVGDLIQLGNTNGWQNWADFLAAENVTISAGDHELMIQTLIGGFNLNYYQFDLITSNKKEENIIPNKLELEQNYPNPFGSYVNGEFVTRLNFTIPAENKVNGEGDLQTSAKYTNVQLVVYDILGRKIATLLDESKLPGTYTIEFDASGLPSGYYFYRLKAGEKTLTKKMLLLK